MRAFVALSLIAVAAGGCKRANDKYCDAATPCETGRCNEVTNECEADPPDAGIDAAVCGTDQECTVQTSPICDDGSGLCRGCDTGDECLARDPARPECADDGACVECLASDMCDAATPICAEGSCAVCTEHTQCEDRDTALPRCAGDGTCVECTEHTDCASTVCDRATNECVDATAIIYVNPGGTDIVGCGDPGSACQTITFALTEVVAGRTTLSAAAGTYSESVVASDLTATIVGPSTAVVISSLLDQSALYAFNNAHLTIDGMTFRGAFGMSSEADGLRCSTSSSLTVFRTIVTGNEASGIDAGSGCSLSLEEVVVSNNERLGIFVSDGGELVLQRSTVIGNDGGGIEVRESSFAIVNNFVVQNGTSTGGGSLVGGVRIELSSTEPMMVFDFNTVAENQSSDAIQAHGVLCIADTTVSNNIVWGGTGAASVAGNCTWAYSDVEGGEPGTGNLDVDPDFADVGSDDYHLASTSPVKDMADPAATTDHDFDGEPRPVGPRSDIGADEVQ